MPLASTNLVAHISGIPDLADRDAWHASTEAFATAFPDDALELHDILSPRNQAAARSPILCDIEDYKV